MGRSARPHKKVPDSALSGQQGVNVVEAVALTMGYTWAEPGAFDSGIDGRIELRDRRTSEPLARYVGVQSKVRERFTAETDEGFEFLCDEADVRYWARSTDPVILVCAHATTREAWFKCVSDWFADSDRRASRRVVFDKRTDVFDGSRADELMHLAFRSEPTVPRRPKAPPETQVTNLLPIVAHPATIWSAPTDHYEHWQVRKRYEELGLDEPWASDYLLRDGHLHSLRDPATCHLREVCDTDRAQCIDAEQWADATEPKLRRYWTELLRRALLQQVKGRLSWHPLRHVFHFAAPDPIDELFVVGPTGAQRKVIKVKYFTHKPTRERRLSYVRHLAFAPRFKRVHSVWHLAIEPDFLFTHDGQNETMHADELLAGIKRIERNKSVLAHIELWQHVLAEPPSLLALEQPLLTFGSLVTVEVPIGLDDRAWRTTDSEGGDVLQEMLAA